MAAPSHKLIHNGRCPCSDECGQSACESDNDRSLGTQKLADYDDKMIAWKARYEPGVIQALGRNAGRPVCTHTLKTAGEARAIRLSPDRRAIAADRRDLCHIEVEVLDGQGIPVPQASHPIRFEISGPGQLIGVDNGDLTSHESYVGNSRQAYYGRALAIVQTTTVAGRIRLTATSPGLVAGEVIITSE